MKEGIVRRINLGAGICFFAFSLLVMSASWSMEYYSSLGPGPGFFPFWLGLLMAILSTIWIVQIGIGWKREAGNDAAHFLPERAGLVRVLSICGALGFLIVLMETIGFQLSMFAFLVFLLIALGRVSAWLTFVVAVTGSFGLNYAFTTWLDVQLPASSLSVLAAFGL